MAFPIIFNMPSGEEIEIWVLPHGTVGLSVDSGSEGGVAYLQPEEARQIAGMLVRAAEQIEAK